MEKQGWQRTRQAFRAVGRGLVILSMSVLLAGPMGGCGTCKNGVEKMGNGSTEFLKKGEDPNKKKVAEKDSTKPAPDSLTAKNWKMKKLTPTEADSMRREMMEELEKKYPPQPLRRDENEANKEQNKKPRLTR